MNPRKAITTHSRAKCNKDLQQLARINSIADLPKIVIQNYHYSREIFTNVIGILSFCFLALIKQWKAQMAQNAGGDNGAPAKVQKTENSSQKREKEKEKTSESKDDFTLGASIQPTADPVRNKSRELLQKALLVDKDKFNPQFVSLMAAKIEGKATDHRFLSKIVKTEG